MSAAKQPVTVTPEQIAAVGVVFSAAYVVAVDAMPDRWSSTVGYSINSIRRAHGILRSSTRGALDSYLDTASASKLERIKRDADTLPDQIGGHPAQGDPAAFKAACLVVSTMIDHRMEVMA